MCVCLYVRMWPVCYVVFPSLYSARRIEASSTALLASSACLGLARSSCCCLFSCARAWSLHTDTTPLPVLYLSLSHLVSTRDDLICYGLSFHSVRSPPTMSVPRRPRRSGPRWESAVRCLARRGGNGKPVRGGVRRWSRRSGCTASQGGGLTARLQPLVAEYHRTHPRRRQRGGEGGEGGREEREGREGADGRRSGRTRWRTCQPAKAAVAAWRELKAELAALQRRGPAAAAPAGAGRTQPPRPDWSAASGRHPLHRSA